MSLNTKSVSIDVEAVKQHSEQKNEPKWMADLRVESMHAAQSLELPFLEKTKLDRWHTHSFGVYQRSHTLSSVNDLPHESGLVTSHENLLVQVNSGKVYVHLSEDLKQKGVIFTDLESALHTHSELVKSYFMKAVLPQEHQFTALHAALWSGGVFLYIPKNFQVEKPLQVLFMTNHVEARFSPHVLIVAEANSSVTYVENTISSIDQGHLVHSGIMEVFVKPGATVRVASVHHLQPNVTDFTYRRAIVEANGTMDWTIGEMNDGNAVSDTTTILQGHASSSQTKTVCIGSADQKLNLTTKVIHYGKHSQSDMLTRAVMRDQATAIINGITKIEKGATGTNGQQTEKILMLSPSARGDANPILLIDEDDVKAGHAASVGQVNADQIFYLMSRGIRREDAEKLIIYGFLAPIVTEIPIQNIQEQLQSLIERKLGQ
jgi:Fe-S cluster assembly protein SufD